MGVYDKQQIYDTLNYYGINTEGAYGGYDKGRYGKGRYAGLVDQDTVHRFIKSRSRDFRAFVENDIAQGAYRYDGYQPSGNMQQSSRAQNNDFDNDYYKTSESKMKRALVILRDLMICIILACLSYKFIPIKGIKWVLTIFFCIGIFVGLRGLYNVFIRKE
jgi:hypothetical protein